MQTGLPKQGKPPFYVLAFDELHLRMGLIETVLSAGLHRKTGERMKDEKPSDLHSADQTPEAGDPELRYQAFLEVLLALEEPELTYESEIMPWWIFPHLE